jgi:RNA polymerase sigma-70 factor, ECF subfamily
MSSPNKAQIQAESTATIEGRRELEWLRRAQNGDRGAFGQIVLSYQDRLFNAILRMIGDREEARDLTQETFVKGFSNLNHFRGDASPYTWLFRIAMNLTISQLRKVQRHRVFSLNSHGHTSDHRHRMENQASTLVDQMAAEASPDAPNELQRKEVAEQVIRALGRLDAEYRAVLVMRDIEGFDYQQMSEILELPLGTLKSRIFRARLALRDELRSYMAHDRK